MLQRDLRSFDQARSESLVPPSFVVDTGNTIELRGALALLAENDGPDSTSLYVTSGQRTNAAQTAGAEVDDMSSSFGEGGRSRPVDRLGKDLVAERLGKGLFAFAKIRT
jgi:hypothetical protein